ncbi:hypothetical protein C8R43DRAFT_1121661 [Mycena crocata]|nr:hypothetical protein C8R43DRAFT_1121661 [Mycena crocata]
MKFRTLVSLAVIGLATIAGAAPAPGFTIHTDIIVHGDQEKLPDSPYAVSCYRPVLTMAEFFQVSSLVEEASAGTTQCADRGYSCTSQRCCPGLRCHAMPAMMWFCIPN